MTRTTIAYALGLIAAATFTGQAQAAATLQSFTFQAQLTSGPTPNVTGGFTLLQDEATQAATLQSINFTIGTTVFTLANATLVKWNVGPDLYMLYGNLNGNGVQGTTEDFYFTFNPFTQQTWQLAYSQKGYGTAFASGSALTIQNTTAAVPEPAVWAMMIAGFGLAGGALRRRPRVAQVRFA